MIITHSVNKQTSPGTQIACQPSGQRDTVESPRIEGPLLTAALQAGKPGQRLLRRKDIGRATPVLIATEPQTSIGTKGLPGRIVELISMDDQIRDWAAYLPSPDFAGKKNLEKLLTSLIRFADRLKYQMERAGSEDKIAPLKIPRLGSAIHVIQQLARGISWAAKGSPCSAEMKAEIKRIADQAESILQELDSDTEDELSHANKTSATKRTDSGSSDSDDEQGLRARRSLDSIKHSHKPDWKSAMAAVSRDIEAWNELQDGDDPVELGSRIHSQAVLLRHPLAHALAEAERSALIRNGCPRQLSGLRAEVELLTMMINTVDIVMSHPDSFGLNT